MTDSTSSLRIAHVADLHIGSSYVHGNEDRGGVNSRLVDFRDAWVRSCRQMVADAVDLVLFAGDAFRDCNPSPTEEAGFRAGLDVLADADIQVIATPGNHDIPKAFGRTNALEGFAGYRGHFTLVTRPDVVCHEVARLGGALVPVACFPYPMRAHLAAADPEFEKLTLDEQNAKIVTLSLDVLRGLGAEAESLAGPYGSILMAHGTIGGSQIGAQQSTAFLREPVLPISELRGLPFAAQCWGHLHRAQSFGDKRFEIGDHIRYSGSIERVDFAEADEDKGFWIIDLDENPLGPTATWEWRSSDPRPFVDIDLTDFVTDMPEGWQGVGDQCVRGAVVRVRYTTTPEIARTIDNNAIRRALLGAGAVKVKGPEANIVHTVTDSSDAISEDTDVLTGWAAWATLQGLDPAQRERLDRKVADSLEEVLR